MKRITTLFVFGLSLFSATLVGQTHIWNGNGGDNNWFTASNWSSNSVPDAASTVEIPSGFTVEIITGIANCNSLDLVGNAVLTLSNDMNIGSQIQIASQASFVFREGIMQGPAVLDNNGTLQIEGSALRTFNAMTINNHGLFLVTNSNQTFLIGDTIINNAATGTLDIASVGGFLQQSSHAIINNDGLFRKSPDGISPIGNFYVITEVNNTGIIEVLPDEIFLFLAGGSDFVNLENGLIEGSGTLDITANFINEGTVAPAGIGEVGTLHITNNFDLGASATLEIDIEGTSQGLYDSVEIVGAPNLEGNLKVLIPGSTQLSLGDEFTIVTADLGINTCDLPSEVIANDGSFEDYIFEVECNSNSVVLRVIGQVLSISENELLRRDFFGFPNPSSTQVQFTIAKDWLSRQDQEVSMRVYNAFGQLIKQDSVVHSEHTLIIESFTSGLYFVELVLGETTMANSKLIVE